MTSFNCTIQFHSILKEQRRTVTSHQSPVTSHQSPVTSHQSPVTSYPLPKHIL
ncbi:MAG: hypothetical protein F6K03_06885 [Kamptonema sp. SIO4C4]|nr:hypothetical protein [Kamptonema sp. SIO4C4]